MRRVPLGYARDTARDTVVKERTRGTLGIRRDTVVKGAVSKEGRHDTVGIGRQGGGP